MKPALVVRHLMFRFLERRFVVLRRRLRGKARSNERNSRKSTVFPVLPLRDIVVFPHMIVPLFVGREKSIHALEEVMKDDKQILLVAQKNASQDDPGRDDIYRVGTVSSVLQLLKLPDGTVKVLVEGNCARHASRASSTIRASSRSRPRCWPRARARCARPRRWSRAVVAQFEQYVKLNKKVPPEVLVSLSQIEDPAKLADTVAAHLSLKISDKQELLETGSLAERLERLYGFMEGEISVLQVEKRIRSRVKRQMEKTQREYYLNEQMKAIQKELGELEDGKDEASELEERIKKTKLSKEARDKARGRAEEAAHDEPDVGRGHGRAQLSGLDAVAARGRSGPRSARTSSMRRTILDTDHYGLEKVKERIVEYLAVQQRVDKMKGPILCLVGPPGVGKTSLGKSLAKATGRNFIRFSLGGIRDEAEIRGHRRTYIGSMPGKIIQSMKKAKSSNPLFMLDEIDKMGADFRGDPSSALLEVLDPEQNVNFNDHYLEVDYDLSDVMFVCTANTLRMPQPLLDRMEIIRLAGYTEDEKVEIAKRHLIPKQRKEHGLKDGEWSIDDDALLDLIRYFTREAGVRSLEREIANLARKAVKEIVGGEQKAVKISRKNVDNYAGVRKYRYGEAELEDQIGVVTGLAWTEVGGELLSIEAVTVPGKGKMTITGKLGEVMQELVQAAKSYVRSRALMFGIKPRLFDKVDIHIHVPEGATPKDGPSAGVGMATSIVSVLTRIPVQGVGRDDRRGHAARPGAADRRAEGEAAGGVARRPEDRGDPEGQREGPGGDPGQREDAGWRSSRSANVDDVLRIALERMPESLPRSRTRRRRRW